ncbi:MAG: hypothetical protein ACT4QC_21190 [Planctomycetaceae bacterium]
MIRRRDEAAIRLRIRKCVNDFAPLWVILHHSPTRADFVGPSVHGFNLFANNVLQRLASFLPERARPMPFFDDTMAASVGPHLRHR